MPSFEQTAERKETDAAKSWRVSAQKTFRDANPLFGGRVRARQIELEELSQGIIRIGLCFPIGDFREQGDAPLEQIGVPSERPEEVDGMFRPSDPPSGGGALESRQRVLWNHWRDVHQDRAAKVVQISGVAQQPIRLQPSLRDANGLRAAVEITESPTEGFQQPLR